MSDNVTCEEFEQVRMMLYCIFAPISPIKNVQTRLHDRF